METVIEKLDHLIDYGKFMDNQFVRIMAQKAKDELIKTINVNYTEL